MLDQDGVVARGGDLGMPQLKERRAKGPEGFREYLVFTVTYARGEVVERFYPGTQYQHKRGYFKARDSIFGTGDVVLTCTKPISWSFTRVRCPVCYDRMCTGHINRGYCDRYR